MAQNARSGGQALWWIVAVTEEVSIEIYQAIHPFEKQVDPLFYAIHKRHMEEEMRHHNYAFLMLDVNESNNPSLKHRFQGKTDLIKAQLILSGWVLCELRKAFRVKSLRAEHPWFETLASCIPLFKALSHRQLAAKLLGSAPYVSLLLNTRNHPLTQKSAERHGAFSLPFPSPENAVTFTDA